MYYSIHEFSKKLNKSPQTLRNWDKNGYLKPAYKSVNGYRYDTDDQLNFVLGIKPDRKVIGYNTAIEIIDNTPKSEQEELVEDLVQIITVFSCKLQGKRANKMKKVIQELKGENI